VLNRASSLVTAALTVAVPAAAVLLARPRPVQASPLPPDTLTTVPDTARWDDARVEALVRRAIRARQDAWSDSTLRDFEAHVEAHIFFLAGLGADEEAGGGRSGDERVIRADQLALRVRWRAPNGSVQTIVGRRSQQRLPTHIRYHLDHLSLVLANFGDRIQIGEGTEVRNVLHPIAPAGPSFYRYRLADSIGIRMAGRETTLYLLEVRPRNPADPGVVGSIYLDGATGAVARMRFTFTPSAYRDRSLAAITVDLESALHEGRWWLPSEQWVEIRRRSRWLSFPLTGVIRTHLEVRDLRINVPGMPVLPSGGRVMTLDGRKLGAYDGWSDGLFDDPAASGLRGALGPEEVRREARRLVQGRILGAGGRLAPSLPDASSAFRVRRSEGVLVGAGARYRLSDADAVDVWAGWPFEAERPEWRVRYRGAAAGGSVTAEAYGNRFTDIGPFSAAPGAVSTAGFIVGGEDFTDPYFRTGGRVALTYPTPVGSLQAGVRLERERSAHLVAFPPRDELTRPVRPARRGDLAALELDWKWPFFGPLAGSWRSDVDLQASTSAIGDFGYTRAVATLDGRAGPGSSPWGWEARLGLGLVAGSPPPQALLLAGGRGTVPGYPFRAWGGDRAAFASLAVTHELVGPLVRLRALAAVGWIDRGPTATRAAEAWDSALAPMGIRSSAGVRPSVGGGLDVLDGILRLEAARGLDHGRWEWMVSVDPRLARIL
jgi:hypothetical protein